MKVRDYKPKFDDVWASMDKAEYNSYEYKLGVWLLLNNTAQQNVTTGR